METEQGNNLTKTDKEILLLLTDEWADWEAAYAVASINETPVFQLKQLHLTMRQKNQ